MRRLIAVLVVGLFMLPQPAAGQSLAPGARVRVTYPGEGTRTGQVVSLTADTLQVHLDGRSENARMPLDHVTQLEVSRGMQRPLMRRAGIGFVVGGVVGAVAGATAGSDCAPNSFCDGGEVGAVFGGFLIGSMGGVLGLVAGLIPSEKWERVVVQPRRIGFDAKPAGRGAMVGLSLAF